jgi:hypothetical protein
MANTTNLCTISGDGDVVGPGVRLSVYIQCLLAIIKIFAKGEEVLETSKFGSLTSLSLIISAVARNNLHHLLLLEISQFVSILLVTTFLSLMFFFYNSRKTHNKFKKFYSEIMLSFTVYLITICYNVWLWTTIKWRLPEEDCGNQVKLFLLTLPLDPIGWIRLLFLIGNCFSLAFLSIIFLVLLIIGIKEREEIYFIRNRKSSLDLESNDSLSACYFKTFFLLTELPGTVIAIASIELSIQRNSISGIWEWGFGQIVAMVLAITDVIKTFIIFYNNIMDSIEGDTGNG